MSGKVYLYPIWVRLWHLINALSIIMLIITGISLQYTAPGKGFIPFNVSVQIHNIFGLILTFSYIFFLTGNLLTQNGKHYVIKWKGFSSEITKQLRYYIFGLFRHEKPPFEINEKRKFNPLQKVTYSTIMYFFVPLVTITGLGLMFPELIFVKKIFNYSGILFTDLIHIIAAFLISIFLLVHIYLCTLGIKKSNSFKSILNGYHVNHD